MFSYWYLLPSLFLSPILLKQGKETREKFLKLPEPEGSREGIVGQGEILKLLILGDSAGAGVGVETQEHALSGQIAKNLSKTHNLDWKLLATTGHTTADVVEYLPTKKGLRFDVALISLGVNDVTSFISPKKWIKQCESLIQILEQQFSVKRIIWSDLPEMEKFPALPQPLRWLVGARKNHLRKYLVKYISRRNNLELLVFPDELTESQENINDWIAIDGFHPGPRVYTIWAEEFVKQFLDKPS